MFLPLLIFFLNEKAGSIQKSYFSVVFVKAMESGLVVYFAVERGGDTLFAGWWVSSRIFKMLGGCNTNDKYSVLMNLKYNRIDMKNGVKNQKITRRLR